MADHQSGSSTALSAYDYSSQVDDLCRSILAATSGTVVSQLANLQAKAMAIRNGTLPKTQGGK